MDELKGIKKGTDLLDEDILEGLDPFPVWEIYKLFRCYIQIIKADLYDINIDIFRESKANKDTTELKNLESKLFRLLGKLEYKTNYIRDNIYKKNKEQIKYEVLKNDL